jgi:hypothetical protein
MDDRKRALENDPRAKMTAPPAPDPTAIPDDANFKGLAPKGGFTGLEAIWDYFYWQTLSINMVDSVGHIVRLGLTAAEGCSDIRNYPPENAQDEELFAKCNQWIGGHQPGVTTPDFTIQGAKARPGAAGTGPSSATGHRKTDRRGPGELEAPPIPGRVDPSKPNVTLPPLIRDLLRKLAPDQLPNDLRDRVPDLPPNADDIGPETLLDFLLAP